MRGFVYRNIENMDEVYEGVGKYEIPPIDPIRLERSEMGQLKPFSDAMAFERRKPEECKNFGLHFYLDDYRFIRMWRNPEHYVETLTSFAYMLSPDFSMYAEDPKAFCIYQHYRKHYLARYYTERKIKVVPTICWSEPDSYDYCFDGEPENSTVSISTVGVMRDRYGMALFKMGFDAMCERLNPYNIMVYGYLPDWMKDDERVIRFRSFGDVLHEKGKTVAI